MAHFPIPGSDSSRRRATCVLFLPLRWNEGWCGSPPGQALGDESPLVAVLVVQLDELRLLLHSEGAPLQLWLQLVQPSARRHQRTSLELRFWGRKRRGGAQLVQERNEDDTVVML